MVEDALNDFIPSMACKSCHSGGGCGIFKCKPDKSVTNESLSKDKAANKLALNFLSHPQMIFSVLGQTQTDKLDNQEVNRANFLGYRK